MKNVLFATTALVAVSAGSVWADAHEGISLSGEAELGITYNDTDDDYAFVQDFNVEFSMAGASESGLTFGAAGNFDDEVGDTSVFVSGAFGTLTLGDTDSAYDFVSVGIVTGGLDDEADYYYSDAGGDGITGNPILRYDYTISGFTFAVSIEQGADSGDLDETSLDLGGLEVVAEGDLLDFESDDVLSAGIGYTGDFGGTTIALGLGYQAHEFSDATTDVDVDFIMLSGRAEFGDFGVNASYELIDLDGTDVDVIGLSADYTSGPITVGANWVTVDVEDGDDADSYGLFGSYDLGGGLSAVAAVSNSDVSGDDEVRAGFGFAMSF